MDEDKAKNSDSETFSLLERRKSILDLVRSDWRAHFLQEGKLVIPRRLCTWLEYGCVRLEMKSDHSITRAETARQFDIYNRVQNIR